MDDIDHGKLRLPVSLVNEARALNCLDDSHHEHKGDLRLYSSDAAVTQDVVDVAARMLEDGASVTLTEDQWKVFASLVDWLDIDRLQGAVITNYKTWFAKDRTLISGYHDELKDLHNKVDVSLARRIISDTIRDGKDVCSLAQRQNVWEVKSFGGHSNYAIYAFAVLPDGRLASGSADGSIKLWNVVTGSCTSTIFTKSSTVWSLVVVPDGRLACGGDDGSIHLWDTCTNVCTATLNGHLSRIDCLTVLPDGRLASGSNDKCIRLWNISTNICTATLVGHSEGIYALAVLPDGRLASGSADGSIKLWQTTTNSCTATLNCRDVVTLAVLPDGRLASGSLDSTIKLWNTATKECTATLINECAVFTLTVLLDGRLACKCENGLIAIWNIETGVQTARLGNLPYSEMIGMVLLSDGRLASSSPRNCISLWDTVTEQCTAKLQGNPDTVTSLGLLADGRVAVAYHDRDNSVWVWNHVTRSCDAVVRGHTRNVRDLVGLGDGRLATASDEHVRLWDVSTNVYTVLSGHTDPVTCLAVLPGGVLASGSADKTIRIWDTVSLRCLHVLSCPDRVQRITLLADGHLVVKTEALRMLVWRTDTYEKVVWRTDTYETVVSANLPFNAMRLSPSKSDTLDSWTQKLQLMWNNEPAHNLSCSATLQDGRVVKALSDKFVSIDVDGETVAVIPFITTMIVGEDGALWIGGAGVYELREVSSRANLYLAFVAIGLSSLQILKIMS